MVWRFTQGIASLALGYGGHWAFSPLGLTGLCATMTFQPASFDRDEQSVTYSWYAENPFKIHRPRGPSKKKELTDPWWLIRAHRWYPCSVDPRDHRRRRWALTIAQWPCGVPLSKTRIAPMRTDGSFHGFFTLAPLPTAWFWCAVGATDCHGFFRMRRVVWENVTRWACLVCEKSVEIREICGRQLSAQCAKEQAGCFYSPTDLSDKHRCHADWWGVKWLSSLWNARH